jgi:hypothetical protein
MLLVAWSKLGKFGTGKSRKLAGKYGYMDSKSCFGITLTLKCSSGA